jgi:hypothetical protein
MIRSRSRSLCCASLLLLVSMPAAGALGQCRDHAFRRGDANGDGRLDLSDSIFVIGHLFTGGPPPGCLDAADANDSGAIDLSDVIYPLNFLFRGGAPPPAPGHIECGLDPTEDELDCAAYNACKQPAPCRSGDCCPEGFYCRKDDGDCEGAGACAERPVVCPRIFDPVCGCDGRTYGNACEAAAAGVSVASRGPCDEPSDCSFNGGCPPGSYCAKADGDCDGKGSCRELPQACPEVYDPVCGCDGRTYGNDCEAAAAGVNVAHRGPCSFTVECAAGDHCPDGYYCAKADGDCEGTGRCALKPEICPQIFDPVCGCDGRTYGNPCEAAAAGASIAHRGPCSATADCAKDGECPPGHYCAKADGDCEGKGTCTERPVLCTREYQPVCGCDGVTYGNACEAAAAGVSIAHRGPCVAAGDCTASGDCPPGHYCAKADGDCGGEGRCMERPEVCLAIYDPVCGCDGRTYSNSCVAAAAGVSVAHRGPCVATNECSSQGDCPESSYCAKEPGDCGGKGVCRARPQGCPDVWDPVCGCDGRTYGNDCEAAAAGASVAYRGECEAARPCSSNGECSDDSYCARAPGDCQGRGTCEERPVACPRIFDPVCGCDGRTYSNDCVAAASGVSVAHRGECEAVKDCSGNGECPAGSYCRKAAGDCDGAGDCSPRPEACILIFDPVCGCDGRTYGNACEAAAAGVNVRHRGTCLP